MKQYIIVVEQEAAKMITVKYIAEEVNEMEIPEKYASCWLNRFYQYNLSFMFKELSNEES